MLRLPKSRAMVINASLFKRALAFLLDVLVLNLVVIYPFQRILTKLMPVGSFENTYRLLSTSGIPLLLSATTAAISVLAILYFIILEKNIGQTLGKLVFNLSVVPVDRQASTWGYLLRSLFLIPVFPFLLLWIVDPVFALFSSEHQRLTESLSRTKVVEKITW